MYMYAMAVCNAMKVFGYFSRNLLFIYRREHFEISLTLTRLDYRNYVDRIWNVPEDVRRSYKVFIGSRNFTEITKVFEQSSPYYIN